MLLFLIPRKQYSFRWTTDDATLIVAATLLVMVVSAGKKADLQRVGGHALEFERNFHVCLQTFHLAYSSQLSTRLTVFPGIFSRVVDLVSACFGYFGVYLFPLVLLPVLLLHMVGCWFLWCCLCGLILVYHWLPWSFHPNCFDSWFSVRASWFFLTLIASTLAFVEAFYISFCLIWSWCWWSVIMVILIFRVWSICLFLLIFSQLIRG